MPTTSLTTINVQKEQRLWLNFFAKSHTTLPQFTSLTTSCIQRTMSDARKFNVRRVRRNIITPLSTSRRLRHEEKNRLHKCTKVVRQTCHVSQAPPSATKNFDSQLAQTLPQCSNIRASSPTWFQLHVISTSLTTRSIHAHNFSEILPNYHRTTGNT